MGLKERGVSPSLSESLTLGLLPPVQTACVWVCVLSCMYVWLGSPTQCTLTLTHYATLQYWPSCISDMIQFSHWTEISRNEPVQQKCVRVCTCLWESGCMHVCGKHEHLLNVGVFLSLYISLFTYWLTAFLIDPIHTNNGHWSPSTSTS